MTESEWLSSTSPQAMLGFLRNAGGASERKLRLFACACCRRIWTRLTDRRSRKIVEVSERYADGLATQVQLNRAWERADIASQAIHLSGGGDVEQNPSQAVVDLGVDLEVALTAELAAATAGAVARGDAYQQIWQLPGKDNNARWAEDDAVRRAAEAGEERVQAGLLRDTFGPLPFRSVAIDPSVLAWNDGLVVRLARAIYDERRWGDLPILGDALLDAGCDSDDILSHCRQQGAVHVRGCFALDLLLGRG